MSLCDSAVDISSNRRAWNMAPNKLCPACGKKLSAAAFNSSARSADGLARNCRACTNARRRERDRSRVNRSRGRAPSRALATALRQGDIPAIRKQLRAGVRPDWSWICETMREGHLALAEALLRIGVKRNVFTMAATGDVKRLWRRLNRVSADARLAASMEPASSAVTPLHVACASDWKSHGPERMTAQIQVAMTLTEHGADLNALSRYRGDQVNSAFERYLRRSAEAGTISAFVAMLDRGATIEQLDVVILSSQEYFGTQGGSTNAGFLNALFQDTLGRPIDGPTETLFAGLLSSGASRSAIAQVVLASAEYRHDLVNSMYEQYLRRPADSAALASGVDQLDAGQTPTVFASEILGSAEYFDRLSVA